MATHPHNGTAPWLRFPPVAADRLPLTWTRFCTGVLPALVAYFLTAFLVCRPETRTYRIALLPVTLLLIWRAAVGYDMTGGDERINHINLGIGVSMSLSS
jgi:hypothetical protein